MSSRVIALLHAAQFVIIVSDPTFVESFTVDALPNGHTARLDTWITVLVYFRRNSFITSVRERRCHITVVKTILEIKKEAKAKLNMSSYHVYDLHVLTTRI